MSKRILKNPFDSQIESEARAKRAAHLLSKVTKIYEHKPFFERWYIFNSICTLGGWVCQLVSPASALIVLTNLFFQSKTILGESTAFVFSISFALIICAGVEILKRYSVQNALVEAFNYKRISLALALALTCSIGSVATSFYGAYTIPSQFHTPPALQSPPLENLANLDNLYKANIESKAQAIEDKKRELLRYETNNQSSSAKRMSKRKGVKAGHETLAKQLHSLESEKSTLEQSHIDKLDKAKQSNQSAIQTAEETHKRETFNFEGETHNKGLILGWASLGFESLFWCFLLFNMWYFKRSQIEFSKFPDLAYQVSAKASQNAQKAPQINNQQPSPEAPARVEQKRLYNGCKTSIDSEGNMCVLVGGKAYSFEGLRNNYNANKSKAKRYTEAQDEIKAEKYNQSAQNWLSYMDILKPKIEI